MMARVCPAWVESVEFPWNSYPRPLWERHLVWLKNIGITHVSLPPAKDPAELAEVIGILRRLKLEADLEGPVPAELQPLTRAHGGPLTEPWTPAAVRISALAPDSLVRSRRLLLSGKQAIVWTDVVDTLDAGGFHAGAVNFAGEEHAAANAIRRNAQLGKYWSGIFASLHEISERQYAGDNGASFVAVVNNTVTPWKGDVRSLYPPNKRPLLLPGVTVPPHDMLWLPVNLPLIGAFATTDRLVYATAELTAMEYENGILAMEFSAPAAAEVVLQISREPAGPLVAGGKPVDFQWDVHTQQVRLAIPKGSGPGNHVRIGLAIEAPDATAFFDSARVLITGETNNLTAEYSSVGIAQRSRLRTSPKMPFQQQPTGNELKYLFQIQVPESAISGDHAELAIEADGIQMSHSQPQLLTPVTMKFADAAAVRLGNYSYLPLFPATIPVNERSGREVTISIRNNAPEIRSFHLELKAEGLEFSPPKSDIVIGASAARDVTVRVFSTGAAEGLHKGEARLSGAASAVVPVQFVVIPNGGAVSYSSGGVTLLESAKLRASFLPGRWLEYIDKDNGQNQIPAGGVPFSRGPIENLRLQDLEALVPKPKK
ncbi:MAG: hypothetical protein ABJC09_14740 [Terriglobia bacterium]